MTTGLSTPGANERLGFRVDGMDCASCVGKIETALGRLGGISDVAVNFATETLLLSRDATSKTTSKDIAKKIRSLGFDVSELPPSAIPAAPVQRTDAHELGAMLQFADMRLSPAIEEVVRSIRATSES